jgi:hypothetical protein
MESILDRYKKRLEQAQVGGGTEFVKLVNGENYLRFIANPSDDSFYIQGWIHNDLDLLGSQKKSILCCKSFNTFDECPVCKLLSDMSKLKDRQSADIVKKCSAKLRNFSYVYPLSSASELSAGSSPKVLSYGVAIETQLLAIFLDPDYGNFADINKGRNITITRAGAGRDTKYTVMPRPNTSKFSCDLTNLPPLEKAIPPHSPEEVEILLGGEPLPEKKNIPTKGRALPKEEEPPNPQYTSERKKCFGEVYSARSSGCQTCPDRDDCREAFLEFANK